MSPLRGHQTAAVDGLSGSTQSRRRFPGRRRVIGSLVVAALACICANQYLRGPIDRVILVSPASAQSTAPNPADLAETGSGRVLNVRDFGARGTGTVNDRDAIQRAANAAQPGDTIYFPPGVYLNDDGTSLGKPNITLLGDGPQSIMRFSPRPGLRIIGMGQQETGIVIKRLKFVGEPGVYKRDGNDAHAIQINDGRGTVISDCDFEGPGFAVHNTGTSYGTRIENCRVDGWGTVALYCNGGEQIINCSLIQDDPHPSDWSSHGVYIHSGAKNVLIQDTLIEKARYYGVQIYGNDRGTISSNIRFERVTFKGCNAGLTIQAGEVDAASARDVVIKDCTFLGTYSSPVIGIKQGDGIQVVDNLIDGTPGAGIQLGGWGRYEPNYSVNNTVVTGNVIRNCDRGIWAQASWGGKFNNVRVWGNTITKCRIPIDITEAPSIVLTPP